MKKILYLFFAAFTILFLVSCHKETNEINVSEIVDIQESAVDILNNLSTPGARGEAVINNCIQQLLTNPEVSSAHFQVPNQIVIQYKSGATGIILFVDEAEEQEKIIPKSTNPRTKDQDDAVRITNNKVLIWDWFNNTDEYDATDALRNLFNNCSYINFEVDIKQGNECTAQSLNNLTQYGFVYISTHGNAYSVNGEELCYILTRQLASPTSLITNEDITAGKCLLVTIFNVNQEYINNLEIATFNTEGTYWGVSNKYISKYVTGTFSSPAIVFVSACKSYYNNSLRNAFINDKNASFYLGYSESVSTKFAYNKDIEFVTNMLQKRLSAADAYDEIDVKTDTTYNNEFNFLEWLNNGHLPPRAMLKYSKKENLTYFTEEDDSSLGQLICDDGRTYPLHSCHYSPGGSLTFLHSNADGEPSYVMAFFSLTMCNTALGNFEPLHPGTTEEWMYFNSNNPLGFWVKNACSDVSSRLSIAGGGSIKMADGKVFYNSATGFSFWFIDETGHRWEGTYNGPIS